MSSFDLSHTALFVKQLRYEQAQMELFDFWGWNWSHSGEKPIACDGVHRNIEQILNESEQIGAAVTSCS